MGKLFDQIREAIEAGRYIVGFHAALRLRQRRIMEWQVAVGTCRGRLVRERPNAKPNPAAEVDIQLADGTSANAVWAWLWSDRTAKLVTVHFYDR
jgi:hypothetical protein